MLIDYSMIPAGFVCWYLFPREADAAVLFLGVYLNTKLVDYIDKQGYW
ncbi:MAG: hypothetical protein ACJARN_001728 [Arenicella sp.]|jgi:hypothetical protein